ncbi:MAG: calcium:proton antiporter [Planctomycetota bacterium]
MSMTHGRHGGGFARAAMRELPIAAGLATGALALAHFSPQGAPDSAASVAWSLWLVVAILGCAFRAMAHADALAERFGEPLGTLILTIAAITIEVAAVCAVMLGQGGDETVARDTMFSVLMIILNLLLVLALLIGGMRRTEQEFNPQSAGAYLPLLVTLGMITLVLPRFTRSAEGGWMSDPMMVFVGLASFVLYAVFLAMQTTKHRAFFAHHGASERAHDARPAHHDAGSPWKHGALLVVALLAVIMVAEGMAGRVHALLDTLAVPSGIGGVFIALLVLAPEGMAALQSARRDDMQRSINILLGSALSTIGLTVPAVIAIHFITGASPEFGLDAPYIVLLVATFMVAGLNLRGGRVNAIQGVVHLLIFVAWVVTILDEGAAR